MGQTSAIIIKNNCKWTLPTGRTEPQLHPLPIPCLPFAFGIFVLRILQSRLFTVINLYMYTHMEHISLYLCHVFCAMTDNGLWNYRTPQQINKLVSVWWFHQMFHLFFVLFLLRIYIYAVLSLRVLMSICLCVCTCVCGTSANYS